MNEPTLVVNVANRPLVNYTGDGEWFGICPHVGCLEWRVGFSNTEAERRITEHQQVCEHRP